MEVVKQIIETANQVTWPGAFVLVSLIACFGYVVGRFIKSYFGK